MLVSTMTALYGQDVFVRGMLAGDNEHEEKTEDALGLRARVEDQVATYTQQTLSPGEYGGYMEFYLALKWLELFAPRSVLVGIDIYKPKVAAHKMLL
jgi:hypothetical protein